MATIAIVGGTGLVGSHIVNTLLSHSSVSHIDSLARRPPPDPNTEALANTHPGKLSRFISSEPPSNWASHLRTSSPKPEIFFSTLATTRALAGGLAAQRALEHDANLDIARAAKDAGTKVYVLVSSVGADSSSRIPYSRLKGDIEDSIIKLGFDKTVILRPGSISGRHERPRMGEGVINGISTAMGWLSKPWLRDWWTQDASVIAKAAVSAGLQALNGTSPEGDKSVWILNSKDIISLGRTEWKD